MQKTSVDVIFTARGGYLPTRIVTGNKIPGIQIAHCVLVF